MRYEVMPRYIAAIIHQDVVKFYPYGSDSITDLNAMHRKDYSLQDAIHVADWLNQRAVGYPHENRS